MFKKFKFKSNYFWIHIYIFFKFGQSFFLGLFNSSIRNELSITHGQFGTIYASATLLSSFFLYGLEKIDDVNVFKICNFCNNSSFCILFFFSKISSVLFLFIGIFLMRFFRSRINVSYCNNYNFKIFHKIQR